MSTKAWHDRRLPSPMWTSMNPQLIATNFELSCYLPHFTLIMGYYYIVLVCTFSQFFFSFSLLCFNISRAKYLGLYLIFPLMKYFVYSGEIYFKHSSCWVCLWSPSDPIQLFFPRTLLGRGFLKPKRVRTGTFSESFPLFGKFHLVKELALWHLESLKLPHSYWEVYIKGEEEKLKWRERRR